MRFFISTIETHLLELQPESVKATSARCYTCLQRCRASAAECPAGGSLLASAWTGTQSVTTTLLQQRHLASCPIYGCSSTTQCMIMLLRYRSKPRALLWMLLSHVLPWRMQLRILQVCRWRMHLWLPLWKHGLSLQQHPQDCIGPHASACDGLSPFTVSTCCTLMPSTLEWPHSWQSAQLAIGTAARCDPICRWISCAQVAKASF